MHYNVFQMQKKKRMVSENSFLEADSQCHPFNFKAESQIKRQCVPVMGFFFSHTFYLEL